MSGYQDHFKKIKQQKKKSVPVKNKKYFSLSAIALSFLGGLGCFLFLIVDEDFISSIPKVNLSFFSPAVAEPKLSNESEIKKDLESDIKEKSNDASTQKNTSDVNDKVYSDEHLSNLIKRSRELDQREESLNKLEQELEQKAKIVEVQIGKLEQTRKDIADKLKDRIEQDQKKIEQLVEVYSSMRPNQAAKILEEIEEDLAIQIITKMKKKNAAEILNVMKFEKSSKFAELFTGYRSPAGEDKP